MDLPLLSLIAFTPLAGAVTIAFVPSRYPEVIRRTALLFALAAWLFSILLVLGIALSPSGFQYVEAVEWIPSSVIRYQLGADGLSALMVLLTTTLTWISILASFEPIKERVKAYMVSFLVLEIGMIGVFLALDLFLFYIFWELVLIPMY